MQEVIWNDSARLILAIEAISSDSKARRIWFGVKVERKELGAI